MAVAHSLPSPAGMPSQSPRSEREQERRLNIRTLAIASAAAAAAALVTSRLWFAGTWIAAAFTPVIVAVVSELLYRPTERIGRALTSDRTAVFPAGEPPLPAPEPPPGGRQAEPDPDAPPVRRPAASGAGPVRVYRSTAVPPRRRTLALGVVALTAALAFAIAVAVITVPELIAGQSLGNGDKATTLLGGKPRKHRSSASEQPQTTTEQSPTTTQPQQTTTEQQPSETTPPATTETAPPTTTPAPQAAPPATTTPTSP